MTTRMGGPETFRNSCLPAGLPLDFLEFFLALGNISASLSDHRPAEKMGETASKLACASNSSKSKKSTKHSSPIASSEQASSPSNAPQAKEAPVGLAREQLITTALSQARIPYTQVAKSMSLFSVQPWLSHLLVHLFWCFRLASSSSNLQSSVLALPALLLPIFSNVPLS